VDRVKEVDLDRVKGEDGDREVQTDDIPRGRNCKDYTGKNHNRDKARVKNLSEYRKLGTSRAVDMSMNRDNRMKMKKHKQTELLQRC
jgi:hypothetical protein